MNLILDSDHYKYQIRDSVIDGELDSLLLGFGNKSYAYNILPSKIRSSISRSYFYKLLHDRQMAMLIDRFIFINCINDYYKLIEPLLDDPHNLQFNITRLTIMQFKETYNYD